MNEERAPPEYTAEIFSAARNDSFGKPRKGRMASKITQAYFRASKTRCSYWHLSRFMLIVAIPLLVQIVFTTLLLLKEVRPTMWKVEPSPAPLKDDVPIIDYHVFRKA